MSKVSRADWANGAPWDGITGKPTNLGGVSDIGQLSAAGFQNQQVPRWSSSLKKFLPWTPTSSPSPTPDPISPLIPQVQIVWDVPSILPLQSAHEDFPLLGAVPGQPIAHGVAFDPGFCLTFAYCVTNDLIRLKVVNMDSVAVDLGSALWSIQLF